MSDREIQALKRRVVETNAGDVAAVIRLARLYERSSLVPSSDRKPDGLYPVVGLYWVQLHDAWKWKNPAYDHPTRIVEAKVVYVMRVGEDSRYPAGTSKPILGEKMMFAFPDAQLGAEQRLHQLLAKAGGENYRGAVVLVRAELKVSRLGKEFTKTSFDLVPERHVRLVAARAANHAFDAEAMELLAGHYGRRALA